MWRFRRWDCSSGQKGWESGGERGGRRRKRIKEQVVRNGAKQSGFFVGLFVSNYLAISSRKRGEKQTGKMAVMTLAKKLKQ